MSNLGWPVDSLIAAFPDYLDGRLTPGQASMILSTVSDADKVAWNQTIELYKGNFNPALNRYLPDKVATLLNVFRDFKNKQSATNRGPDMSVGQNAPTPAYGCKKCFDTGTALVPDEAAQFSWMMKEIPCPNCVN